MKYRGVAYYPEYWPEERWKEDIDLMLEAHINLVRVGEFAWTAMEPAEGQFTLEWLHRLVGMMGEAGISVMLCTPTATPPAWLTGQYPETRLVKLDGRRMEHGHRRHYCPTHPTFRGHSRRITEALSHEFGTYENVLWQLDNELGPESGSCFCEHCQVQFRLWLQGRYGSLEELNKRWATRFWSVEYSDWDQVRLAHGDMYSAAKLDTQRFRSDCWVDFAQEQASVIRANHPGATVTTNGMGPLYEPINYYDLFEGLDYASDDLYFDIATMDGNAMAMDLYRNYKPGKPFWITETGTGALTADKCPTAGQIRCWAFSALARGCEAYNIFRWRTCLSGQEQELQGVIEYSGRPRRRYQTVKDLYGELETLWPRFVQCPLPTAEVAFIHDYDVFWGYASSRINSHVQYNKRFQQAYKAFYDRNVQVDIVPPDRDISQYKVVVLPSMLMVDEGFAQRLRTFVNDGGVVLALPQLAWRDMNDNYLPACPPVGLNDVFGLRAEGGMYLSNYTGPDQSLWVPGPGCSHEAPGVCATLNGSRISDTVSSWMEDLEPEGGTVLGVYTDNDFDGCPVIIGNSFGQGSTLYCGAYPSVTLLGALTDDILAKAGIILPLSTPEHVEILRRGDYTFIINHRAEPVTVPIAGGEGIVGTYRDGNAILQPHDVCVIASARISIGER